MAAVTTNANGNTRHAVIHARLPAKIRIPLHARGRNWKAVTWNAKTVRLSDFVEVRFCDDGLDVSLQMKSGTMTARAVFPKQAAL